MSEEQIIPGTNSKIMKEEIEEVKKDEMIEVIEKEGVSENVLKLSFQDLRKAIIYSEIIGKPVSRRNK